MYFVEYLGRNIGNPFGYVTLHDAMRAAVKSLLGWKAFKDSVTGQFYWQQDNWIIRQRAK